MLLHKRAHAFYILVLAVLTIALVSKSDDLQLYRENGVMESLQASCLFIATLLFFCLPQLR